MTAPNMAKITASLERSMQNCSLNQNSPTNSGGGRGGGVGFSSSSDSTENQEYHSSDSTLELNSQTSLPYHWEQCLDLKVRSIIRRALSPFNSTGEIYYINWRTGMKAKEDPRMVASAFSGDFYSEDDSSYDSEGSSSESSPSSSVGVCPKCCGQLLHFDRE
ncbi:hypothetical protein RHSIM_Rhsim12G0020700 [Rhododendron simsii]|uniref:Uncharacterized protein n=1 Tax=Rhododendron simsii TaxID=118357 RepID=A0A834G3C6_RHOSS|nr:hypothetical protein RHSIM_Rhsim12G0020700 [Rhododendron simsii]